MPTLWTKTLIPTLRQVPAEAEVPSHQLMLRAGLIRKLASGVYDYLPLGLRSLHKTMAIIREEMAAAGAVEVSLPALVPIELFQQTGRDQAYGDNLFRLTDRHGRAQALGPTHEEVITELVAAYVDSYKQLPLTLYQIQTKFRDEFRPRFGVLRSREFLMKDAYSFHLTVQGPGGLDEIYQKQFDAYCRIFKRCGLPYLTVEAESGPIGGSASHEFMVVTPTGEDTILESDKGNYTANVEKCEIAISVLDENYQSKDLQEIETPNCKTIEQLVEFFKESKKSKLKKRNILKTLVWQCTTIGPITAIGRVATELRNSGPDSDPNISGHWSFFVAVVRGDHEVNEAKLKKVIQLQHPEYTHFELMPDDIAKAFNIPLGYIGPHIITSRTDFHAIVDYSAFENQFWVAGANKPECHVIHFDWRREVLSIKTGRVKVADIRNAVDGDPSPKNDGGILRTRKGIEIGHVFKLGDKYTRAMNVSILGHDNNRTHPIMGCYGIGVNRILASTIEKEKGSDADGIIWPSSIAPFQVVITPIKYEGQAREVADKLATTLEHMQSPSIPLQYFHPDVLIDDRDERPGVKFKDADLIGIPIRITIGDKALAEGKVEIKTRNGSLGQKGELVPIEEAPARVIELLKTV